MMCVARLGATSIGAARRRWRLCPHPGSMPRFLKAAAAAGPVMNLTSALGAVRFLRAADDAAREHRELLDVRRQRTDVVYPGEMRELAHLLEADLGFAARNDAADKYAGRGLLELALDVVGDAHALEQADDVDPAGAGRITDRSSLQGSIFLSASVVLMSGFGAPNLTPTPTPDFARSTRLPGTTLPPLMCSSIAEADMIRRS